MSDERPSRRRLLAALGASTLALAAAGLGGLDRSRDGPDLSVDHSVTPDASPPSTPPAGNDTDRGTSHTRGPFARPDGTSPTPTETPTPAAPTETPTPATRPADDGDGPATDDPSPTSTPTADVATTAVPPVSLPDAVPGDGGTVDLSLTLSGAAARLWLRCDVTAASEGGAVDAERRAGDTGPPGDLAAAVRVRLWHDPDADPVYEGSLAALDADDWVALTAACASPGTHTVRVRWDLPSDAPDTVQTDSVAFALELAADARDC